MGLFVSTTSADVVISELGITIPHPTADYQLDEQFSSEEIKGAKSLTDAILSGTLVWSKVSGSPSVGAGYDPDFLGIEQESTGTGDPDDRMITQKDLTFMPKSFSFNKVSSDKVITIPLDQQMLVHESIVIDGELIIDGELVVI